MKVNGMELKEYIKGGNLLPDDIISRILFDGISDNENLRQTPPESAAVDFFDGLNPGFIVDGYPRTSGQAQLPEPNWENAHLQINAAIEIDVPDEICKAKVLGRRSCTKCMKVFNVSEIRDEDGWDMPALLPTDGDCSEVKCGDFWETRSDDNEEIVEKRLKDYHISTSPVLDYYRSKGMLHTFQPKKGIKDFDKLKKLVEKIELDGGGFL